MTSASPLTVQDFASKVRAKYPGSYDDMPDEVLARRVVAKHPEYAGKVQFRPIDEGQPQPSIWEEYKKSLPTAAGTIHAAGLPANPEEAAQMGREYEQRSVGDRMLDPFRALGTAVRGVADIPVSAAKEEWRGVKGAFTGDPNAPLHTAAGLNPFAAPVVSRMTEQGLGTREAAETGTAGALALSVPEVPRAVSLVKRVLPSRAAFAMTKAEVLEASHDVLQQAAERTKQQLWDAHGQVSQRVGQLDNGIHAADYADMTQKANRPQIPTADLLDRVREVAEQYGAGGKSTPKFNAAVDAISQHPGYASMRDVQSLKMSLRDLWNRAPEGSRDESALNALSEALEGKLAKRAGDLGQAEQWSARNQLWRVLKQYEDKGVIGKLQNADTGKQFFDILRDPANGAELKRATNDLAKFGLDPDWKSQLVSDHLKLHDYVTDTGKSGIRGAFSAIRKHPVAGTVGALGGGAVGSALGHPMLGTLLGAGGAVGAMERASARSAIERLGGVPSTAGRFGAATAVEPVEGIAAADERLGLKPTVAVDDLVSALKNQGIKTAEAKSRAAAAVADNPNDLTAALKQALSGKTTTEGASVGAKASQGAAAPLPERLAKAIEAGHEADTRVAQQPQTYVRQTSRAGFGKADVPIEDRPKPKPKRKD